MRTSPLPVSLRTTVWLLVSAVIVVVLIDGGSVALTRMSVPDAALNTGYVAAAAAKGKPTTRGTALVAYRAAREDGKKRHLHIRTKNFTLYPDGKVKLTATRTARTLVLHRFSASSHLAEVSATVTVSALPFASATDTAARTR
jgi:hypothetical protein